MTGTFTFFDETVTFGNDAWVTFELFGAEEGSVLWEKMGRDPKEIWGAEQYFKNVALPKALEVDWSEVISDELERRIAHEQKLLDNFMSKYPTIKPFAKRKKQYDRTVPVLNGMITRNLTLLRSKAIFPANPAIVDAYHRLSLQLFLSCYLENFFPRSDKPTAR